MIPFTHLDWEEIQTRTTKLNQLGKRLRKKETKQAIYERYSMVQTKTAVIPVQEKWSNKVKWNEIFILNQLDDTGLSGWP